MQDYEWITNDEDHPKLEPCLLPGIYEKNIFYLVIAFVALCQVIFVKKWENFVFEKRKWWRMRVFRAQVQPLMLSDDYRLVQQCVVTLLVPFLFSFQRLLFSSLWNIEDLKLSRGRAES